MRVFVCTDLHGQKQALYSIRNYLKSNRFDAVFMLGDLCNRNDANALIYAHNFITIVEQAEIPLFVVHGNQEPASVRLLYQQKQISVHFNPKKMGDYEVVGVGYGDHFPTDPQFAKGKILLTHEPPRAATIAQMKKLPSLPNAPLIHFSGHLHSLAKVHSISDTFLVQVPAAQNLRAATLLLPSREVAFIHMGSVSSRLAS